MPLCVCLMHHVWQEWGGLLEKDQGEQWGKGNGFHLAEKVWGGGKVWVLSGPPQKKNKKKTVSGYRVKKKWEGRKVFFFPSIFLFFFSFLFFSFFASASLSSAKPCSFFLGGGVKSLGLGRKIRSIRWLETRFFFLCLIYCTSWLMWDWLFIVCSFWYNT